MRLRFSVASLCAFVGRAAAAAGFAAGFFAVFFAAGFFAAAGLAVFFAAGFFFGAACFFFAAVFFFFFFGMQPTLSLQCGTAGTMTELIGWTLAPAGYAYETY